ncbi:MAG: hypothetical protein PWP65_1545 [Clostridia bacterium]|nr:hypothetical protein [Clostridia bacterium]
MLVKLVTPILFLVSAATGCAQTRSSPAAPPVIEFSREGKNLPRPVADWVEANKRTFGGFARSEGDRTYLLATVGERPTGGYGVRIDEVLRGKDGLVAVATLTAPRPGQAVTQAITYPYDLVSIPATAEKISFAFRGAVTVQAIAPAPQPSPEPKPGAPVAQSEHFRVFAPAPGTPISSPVRISGQARVFEGNFLIQLDDGHAYLAEKWVKARAGAPEWGDFAVELPFQDPTSPSGTLTFLTMDPRDGTVKAELTVPVKFAKWQ